MKLEVLSYENGKPIPGEVRVLRPRSRGLAPLAVLPLVHVPNPVLRQPTRQVKNIDRRIRKLVDDMIETMHDANGVGLAANQVGVSLRVAVIQLPEHEEATVLINPKGAAHGRGARN